jgi:F420-non-reducing hydrogenase large subunit
LSNKAYVDLILGDIYTMKSYYMGLVDANNKVNFYDGDIRVIDPDGKEFAKFKPSQYLDYIGEHVEPWSYLKFPFLKKIGWKGFVEGKDSGVYRVAPLARLNVADGMATPLAQEEYERMFKTLGGKPVLTLPSQCTGPGWSNCCMLRRGFWSFARTRRSPARQ